MMKVDRSRIPDPFAPGTPLARRAAEERARIAAMMQSGQLDQRRADFRVFMQPEVRTALNKLFHEKCAYCETPLIGAPGDIEQYRPKGSVLEAPDHPGYWWLAGEWSNLLIACIDCNRQRRHSIGVDGHTAMAGKHNRFPLMDEAMRARGPADDLAREQPLILDPTVDDPRLHLVYSDRGELMSESERGNATISILGLNREHLIRQRSLTLERFNRLSHDLLDSSVDANEERTQRLLHEFREMTADHAPYAGLVRQFAQKMQRQFDAISPASNADVARAPLSSPAVETDKRHIVSDARKKRAAKSTQAYRARMSDYSLNDEEGIRRYKSQRRVIESVSIRDIRGIRSLDVNLAGLGPGTGGWLMFLGENGTGKSTVLHAIALVLAGSDYIVSLIKSGRLSLDKLVRFQCRKGQIAVKLSGFDRPHRLTVFRDRLEFVSPTGAGVTISLDGTLNGDAWPPQTVLAGYGATRLLPRRGHEPVSGGDFARVDNLFDPFVPLLDAQKWLAGLSPTNFNIVAIVLKDLLAIDPNANLERKARRVTVRTPTSNIPLNALSDGYQTVIAATIDILEILSRIWSNTSEAEGIVLIDELDAHLHPTWQMQIVTSLRRALPSVQFITTTHQPLCLRGLTAGEVAVMRRTDTGDLDVLTALPSPADFRVDQLLTSAFFGLNSTQDPGTEQLFDRYYALLAMDSREEKEEAELAALKTRLEGRRQLGDTQREALYLEAIDKILSRQKTPDYVAPAEVRTQAVEEVSAIWQRLMADGIEGSADIAGGGA